AEDRRDAGDRRVELAQDRRQRERDDRGVGQRETGGDGEQDGTGAAGHDESVPPRLPTGVKRTVLAPHSPLPREPILSPAPTTRLAAWPASRPLRAWQREALQAVAEHEGESFLASATPAAGKTTFGLRVAHEMLSSGRVSRVVVVGPTAHICRQWAADAARYGIDLEPNRPNAEGPEPRDRHGVAVIYQAVAACPRTHAKAARR